MAQQSRRIQIDHGLRFSSTTNQQPATNRMNRFGDILIACVLLLITLPMMVFVALAIKSESRGPIFESPPCVGRHGRRFQLLNFRVNKYDPERASSVWGREMTRAGQWLHYTRIESLPQLINVLRGEIRLIGNDAHSPSFLE